MHCIRNLVLLSVSTLAAIGSKPASAQYINSKSPLVPAGAKVTLEPTKTRYFLGENIVAHFGVENVGTEPFTVSMGGDSRGAIRHMRYKITAIDSEGQAAIDPYPSTFNMGGFTSGKTLKTGDSWFDTILLLRYRRFEAPGVYTITLQHDLGWKTDAEHPLPVAEAQIELVMPSPEEAKQLIAELEATPENPGGTIGEKNLKPLPDFGAMSYPVYLPFLQERINAGNLKYLPSVAGIETPEATQALVELLKSPEPTSKATASLLAQRLPDFKWRPNLLGWDEEATKLLKEKRVAASWRNEFVPATREYALKAIQSSDRETLRTATSMIENIGIAEDLPVVLGILNERIEETVRIPRWSSLDNENTNHQGWHFQDDCLILMRCARALVSRGAPLPPVSTNNPASIAVRLNPQATYEGETTAAPQTGWLKHPVPFIRQLTLETLSNTNSANQKIVLTAEIRAILPTLFKDSDTNVRVAACGLAGKSKDKSLLPQVLTVLSKARNSWEISSVQLAAETLGGQYQVWKIWADRLDEKDMLQPAIESLRKVIDSKSGYSWRSKEDGTEGKLLKPRWQQFLKTHRVRLEQGKKFSIEEATWSKDMFPKQFSMS